MNLIKRYSPDAAKRRKAWHKYLNRKARRFGLQVYKPHVNWLLPGEFQDAVARWGDIPGIPADRCYLLYSTARYVSERKVPGATADCGVRYGKSSFFILSATHADKRPHHVFDSFEGLSEPGKFDALSHRLTEEWKQGDLGVGEATVRENLKAFPQCQLHKGWIPHCFEPAKDARFALVHIDVDLYEPTRDACAFFYPRLAKGGVMVFDDHGFASCPGATKAIDEYFADKPDTPLSLPTGQAMLWKA